MDIFDIDTVRIVFPRKIATTFCISEPAHERILKNHVEQFVKNASLEEAASAGEMSNIMKQEFTLEEYMAIGAGYIPILAVRWLMPLSSDLTADAFYDLIEDFSGEIEYEYKPFLAAPSLVRPLMTPFVLAEKDRHGNRSFLHSRDLAQGTSANIMPVYKDQYPVFIFVGVEPLPRKAASA